MISMQQQLKDGLDKFVEKKRQLHLAGQRSCELCVEVQADQTSHAVLHCVECDQDLCESCSKLHRVTKPTASHKLVSTELKHQLPPTLSLKPKTATAEHEIQRMVNTQICDLCSDIYAETAAVRCTDCNTNLCEKCCARHEIARITETHKTVPMREWLAEVTTTMTEQIDIQSIAMMPQAYTCDLCSAIASEKKRPARIHCVECDQKLCENCCARHGKIRDSGTHELITTEDWERRSALNASYPISDAQEQSNAIAEPTCDLCDDIYSLTSKPAKERCTDCNQNLCESCVTRHGASKQTNSHELIPILKVESQEKQATVETFGSEEMQVAQICDFCLAVFAPTERPATTHCVECDKSLCEACTIRHHRIKHTATHKLVSVVEWQRNVTETKQRNTCITEKPIPTCDLCVRIYEEDDDPLAITHCIVCDQSLCEKCEDRHKMMYGEITHKVMWIEDWLRQPIQKTPPLPVNIGDNTSTQGTAGMIKLLRPTKELPVPPMPAGTSAKAVNSDGKQNLSPFSTSANLDPCDGGTSQGSADANVDCISQKASSNQGISDVEPMTKNQRPPITQSIARIAPMVQRSDPEGLAEQAFNETSSPIYTPIDLRDAGEESDKNKVRQLNANSNAANAVQSSWLLSKLFGKRGAHSVSPDLHTKLIRMLPGTTDVRGVTTLANDLYLVRSKQSSLEVYNADDLFFKHQLLVPGMKGPSGLAACSFNKYLFIADSELKSVYRVQLKPNCSITKWAPFPDGTPSGLSMTKNNNVAVALSIPSGSKVIELNTDGNTIREIKLDATIDQPSHAIQLSNDQFLVSHAGATKHRVCEINQNGNIVCAFGSFPGSSADRLKSPCNLALTGANILVADRENSRVQVLNLTLKRIGDVIVRDQDLSQPLSLHVDESKRRIYIGEAGGRLLVAKLPKN